MGKNIVEAKQCLDKPYGDSAPGKSWISDCYAEFKCGPTNTDDTGRSGCLKSEVVPENITKVHKIVLGDCKLNLREIADTLKISEGSEFTIFHESLGMRKLFSKWVPRLLTPDKNNNASRIQNDVWSCSSEVKRIFCVGMWKWMKHGSITTDLELKDRELSGQQLVKAAPMKKWFPKLRLILRAKMNHSAKKASKS